MKQDGTVRSLNGRCGVGKYRTGRGLGYDAAAKKLRIVYDLKNKGYRAIDMTHVYEFKCGKLKKAT